MAEFYCKACGNRNEMKSMVTVAECLHCGRKQTLPCASDKFQELYNKANQLRINYDFDSAYEQYAKIVEKCDYDAEAYWGLLICEYGIEYRKKTGLVCHRASHDSAKNSTYYTRVIQHSDPNRRKIYNDEIQEIEEHRQKIIDISNKEAPYDVFISYKESDENNNRTVDSVLAEKLYDALTQAGYKVFYAPISLESKVGEYQPYIFGALNSAKAMLVLGTKQEYFYAPWVRNEWSRFLALMKKDNSRHLIPCFRDMKQNDMPEELAVMQAQDMNKIGFEQHIVHGLNNVIGNNKGSKSDVTVENLLKRAVIELSNRQFKTVESICEDVLNRDAENGNAYLYKLFCDLKVKDEKGLSQVETSFERNHNYKNAIEFLDEETVLRIKKCLETVKTKSKAKKQAETYRKPSTVQQAPPRIIIEPIKPPEAPRPQYTAPPAKKPTSKPFPFKTVGVCLLIVLIVCVFKIIIPNNQYSRANAFLDAGEYADAYLLLEKLGDHKDSTEIAEKLLAEHEYLAYLGAEVGSTIVFGKYEQDNNWENGYDDIEWIVLENNDNKLLLVSKYALDCKPYHNEKKMVDWNGSFLHTWLNSNFYNGAFSEREKKAVSLTNYVTIDNSDYEIPGGYDTQDYVFLLNLDQVRTHKLFFNASSRLCQASEYAKSLGAYVDGAGYSWWWLCTPGEYLTKVAGVSATGEIISSGDPVNYKDNVVRPAIWLDLEG